VAAGRWSLRPGDDVATRCSIYLPICGDGDAITVGHLADLDGFIAAAGDRIRPG
jgi:hypothetical protein